MSETTEKTKALDLSKSPAFHPAEISNSIEEPTSLQLSGAAASRPLVGFQNHILDLTGSQADRYADSVVAILLGEDRERWLLDLSNLRAAAVPSLLSPAFGAPPWVRGITHIQGRVWTVLDTHHLLRGRPGLSRGGWLTLLFPPPDSDWAVEDPRLALWWSDIVEIAPRNRYTSVPMSVEPSDSAASSWILGQWKDLRGDVWSEMDVARLWSADGVLEHWGALIA